MQSMTTTNDSTMAFLRELHKQETAGDLEFESWLYRLNARAIAYCPGTDRMHKEVPADPATGYAFRCTLCGHHSIFPF